LGRAGSFVAAQPRVRYSEAEAGVFSRSGVGNAYLVTGEKELLSEVELDDLHAVRDLISARLPAELDLSGASSVVERVLKEQYSTTVRPNTTLQFECDFCRGFIYGKPTIEFIEGGRHFTAEECANASKDRKVMRTAANARSS
jgi:hypothetical protein